VKHGKKIYIVSVTQEGLNMLNISLADSPIYPLWSIIKVVNENYHIWRNRGHGMR
jgi:hypothetical protein